MHLLLARLAGDILVVAGTHRFVGHRWVRPPCSAPRSAARGPPRRRPGAAPSGHGPGLTCGPRPPARGRRSTGRAASGTASAKACRERSPAAPARRPSHRSDGSAGRPPWPEPGRRAAVAPPAPTRPHSRAGWRQADSMQVRRYATSEHLCEAGADHGRSHADPQEQWVHLSSNSPRRVLPSGGFTPARQPMPRLWTPDRPRCERVGHRRPEISDPNALPASRGYG